MPRVYAVTPFSPPRYRHVLARQAADACRAALDAVVCVAIPAALGVVAVAMGAV